MLTSINTLLHIIRPPNGGENVKQRLTQTEMLEWLAIQASSNKLCLYASATNHSDLGHFSVFVHAVLVPKKLIHNTFEKLTEWRGSPSDKPSCGLVYGGGKPPRIEYSAPHCFYDCLDLSETDRNAACQQLVYSRNFEGLSSTPKYYELSQALTHTHDLHFLPEKQAWCRFDDDGEVVELAKVETHGLKADVSATMVWIDRTLLDMHMAATDTCLVQMFESNYCASMTGFGGHQESRVFDKVHGLNYKLGIASASNSFIRGIQAIKSQKTAQEWGSILYEREYGEKEYETFLIHDLKNNCVTQCSANPDSHVSYFEKESSLPYATSPAFFNPEVLSKYKADPAKYRLSENSITCRNAWSLQSYDINAAGQVHVYIKDLSHLPIKEQKYWSSFNEKPKGGISSRALTTDFLGQFDTEVDHLRDLKSLLDKSVSHPESWFTVKEHALIEQLHYPVTTSDREWGDTLITLAKCVVEGFNKQALQVFANRNNRTCVKDEIKWGSLRWLEEALTTIEVIDQQVVDEIILPLRDLQNLRTKLTAHAGGQEAAKIRQGLLTKHVTRKKHIEYLAGQLVHSLETTLKLLNENH